MTYPNHHAIIKAYKSLKSIGFVLETTPKYALHNRDLGITIIQPNIRSNQVAMVTDDGCRYNCIISDEVLQFIQEYINHKEERVQ